MVKARSVANLNFSTLHVLAVAILLVLLAVSTAESNGQDSSNDVFKYIWETSKWGTKCEMRTGTDGKCCGDDSCVRTRKVWCSVEHSSGAKLLSSPVYADRHHCNGRTEPNATQSCRDCSRDCVLTTWGSWSECSGTCSPAATRYRTRRVVLPPVGRGQVCEELSEIEPCGDGLPSCSDSDYEKVFVYTWRVGPWTSCRKFNNDGSNVKCGPGRMTRKVSCLDEQGTEVHDQSLCERGGLLSWRPSSAEACTLPCDCEVSQWSDWSSCTDACLQTDQGHGQVSGRQKRSRVVTTTPQNGGLPCPHLIESRRCQDQHLDTCPTYRWHSSEWGDCEKLAGPDGTTLCGSSYQHSQVYCIQNGGDSQQPVEDSYCQSNLSSHKPPQRRACQVACPQDCQLGHWQNWSPCSQSCGSGGQKLRRRDVLVPPANGGAECGALVQATPCPPVECAWWHTGRWSACFPASPSLGCGQGTQFRVLFCKSALDQVLDPSNCSQVEPARNQPCSLPCPSDCVISEWSGWSPCSQSCGVRGGTQRRTRQILAYPDASKACDPDLEQDRVCNQMVLCLNYMWQVGAWTVCSASTNSTHPTLGSRSREVFCERISGVHEDDTFCDSSSKPAVAEECDLPTPVDCELSGWTAWSHCTRSCGSGARTKSRWILKLAAHGGAPCPREAGTNGVVTAAESCDELPPCYTYSWSTADWSSCIAMEGTCGSGYQIRSVQCTRSDLTAVEKGLCLKYLWSSPPSSHRKCHIPCAGDCVLSDWSEFGDCSKTCGFKGYKKRTREIAFLDEDNPDVNRCPRRDLVESIPCNQHPCPTYSWDVGQWGSCSLHGPVNELNYCGDGIQRRSVLCHRNDGQHVSHHHCDHVEFMPDSHQPCTIVCPVDCQVSDWSAWAPCSSPCGQGYKWRTRQVLNHTAHGGQLCPELEQAAVCEERLCQDFEWQVGEWSSCAIAEGYEDVCGTSGVQSREVVCPAGAEFEEECLKRATKPEPTRSCSLPCPGDCVMSGWSEFDPPCRSRNCDVEQRRSREVLRRPAAVGGRSCGHIEETNVCSGADPDAVHQTSCNYSLSVGQWSTCIPSSGVCGQGVQNRPLECLFTDESGFSVPVASSFCAHWSNSSGTLYRPCEVPCSQDCLFSEFSEWSACSSECGLDGFKHRSRVIYTHAMGNGRTCPAIHSLTEVAVCNVKPCYSYDWVRGPWGECDTGGQGCGVGSRRRVVECRRSDGEVVNHIYCLLRGNPQLVADQTQLEELLESVNATALDINTQEECGSVCPNDCQLSEWTRFGQCLTDCYTSGEGGKRVRSRHILSHSKENGQPCPIDLYETRLCSTSEAICPRFRWLETPQRDPSTGNSYFSCYGEGVGLVTGACNEATKPTTDSGCVPSCIGEFSFCENGVCKCWTDYQMGNDGICYPSNEYCGGKNELCTRTNTLCNPETNRCECVFGMYFVNGSCVRSNEIMPPAKTTTLSDTTFMIFVGISIAIVIILIICITIFLYFIKKKRERNYAENGVNEMRVCYTRNNLTPGPGQVNIITNPTQEIPRPRPTVLTLDQPPKRSKASNFYSDLPPTKV